MAIYEAYPELLTIASNIDEAVKIIIKCYEKGNKLLICGNGGSAADAEHISGELLKSFTIPRPIGKELKRSLVELGMEESIADTLEMGLPAIPLISLTSLSTAFSNDRNPETVFAQGVNALGKNGDVLIALTTSGNSKNVLYAAMMAKAKGIKVIAMTGRSGGKIRNIADITLMPPSTETYRVQEYHLPIYHHICAEVERHFFSK